MAETPEGLAEGMLVSNAASPDGAPNGKIISSDAPNIDADGDVDMEQVAYLNGHAEMPDAKLVAQHDAFATYRSPNHLISPHQADAGVDDSARPPPAKRARKLSDADQASIANVSQALVLQFSCTDTFSSWPPNPSRLPLLLPPLVLPFI